MKILKINSLITLVLAITLMAGCKSEKPQENNDINLPASQDAKPDHLIVLSRAQFESAEMKTGVIQPEKLEEFVRTTGYLSVPQEYRVVISSYLGGYASITPLLLGDYVKKGQFLINLTNPDIINLQQDYLVSKQKLNYLKSVYDRQVVLAAENINSQDMLLMAESDYNNMLTTKAALGQTLRLINIDPEQITPETVSPVVRLVSPIDGYIASVNAVNGQFSGPGEKLFEIINTDHLHLEMKIFEKDVMNVTPGQKIRFTLPDVKKSSFTGEVFKVGKSINMENRTVDIHAHPDIEYGLPGLIGMFVQAEIVTADRMAECVPVEALASLSGIDYIFVMRSAGNDSLVFEKIPVSVGLINDQYAEILPSSVPLIQGQQILINGVFGLMQE
ncbi:MAG: efflux RND transporter periplasmic adaptor subunit [Bacteroidales bacterium]|nr:efflux RND transporter periplasmic adaptor subunit [Bacteroidales bacterium]